ncbi:MAG: URC4/urg3 family protein, partial [Pseudomonadota bacterium]|nr:URC4/urg3 family protein [Pseudomonadota bacterium]
MRQPRGDLALNLLTAGAVRERAHLLLGKAEQGVLNHFAVHPERLPALADAVAGVTRRRYPDGGIPCHARWRHFTANGRDRWSELAARRAWRDVKERARAAFDLAIVSVLLDAGAGPDWSYRDGTGACLSRSEGLAIASIEMFAAGCFSQDCLDPLRVDADRLQALSEEELGRSFQVSAANPLVGLSGRHALLR